MRKQEDIQLYKMEIELIMYFFQPSKLCFRYCQEHELFNSGAGYLLAQLRCIPISQILQNSFLEKQLTVQSAFNIHTLRRIYYVRL